MADELKSYIVSLQQKTRKGIEPPIGEIREIISQMAKVVGIPEVTEVVNEESLQDSSSDADEVAPVI